MALVVCDMSTSLDGYVTCPNDSRQHPLGDGGEVLHDWNWDAATDVDRAMLQTMILGGGTPLFSTLTSAISLERTNVQVTPAATHLSFRVVR